VDRETLLNAVRGGPVAVSMDDGQRIVIPSTEFCLVDDIAAHVLYRDDAGAWKTKIASLVYMTAITPLESQPN